jgi:hypothetical protein
MFEHALFVHGNSTNSGAALLCRLVLMTRRNSPQHSHLHLFGFRECARFCTDDGWTGICTQAKSDAKELLTVWTDLDTAERISHSLRPSIRSSAIYFLAMAFAAGDDVVCEQWGEDYPRQAISSFYDNRPFVRTLAVIGLAGSL